MTFRIVRADAPIPDDLRGASLALGNFDGVHKGHQAVIAAARHVGIGPDCRAVVLGGTGPVGQRVARLLAGKAAEVTLASRSHAKAAAAARRIEAAVPQARIAAVGLDEGHVQRQQPSAVPGDHLLDDLRHAVTRPGPLPEALEAGFVDGQHGHLG